MTAGGGHYVDGAAAADVGSADVDSASASGGRWHRGQLQQPATSDRPARNTRRACRRRYRRQQYVYGVLAESDFSGVSK